MWQENRWHHAPPHRFQPGQTYFVNGSTLEHRHFFRGDQRLKLLESTILDLTARYGWSLEEWAAFSDHYHWIGQASRKAKHLKTLVQAIHSATAREVNRLDATPGRRVWYEFWDTAITYETSYWSRLSYVHSNPVHHGLVHRPEDYPYCSARRILLEGLDTRTRRLRSHKWDQLKIRDDFDPIW